MKNTHAQFLGRLGGKAPPELLRVERESAGEQIGETKMSTTTKSNRKQELEAGIYTKHDMEAGQAYSWEACGTQSTAVCSICGLRHKSGSGGQNTGHFDRWSDARGNMLTLAEAAKVQCA